MKKKIHALLINVKMPKLLDFDTTADLVTISFHMVLFSALLKIKNI